MLGPHISTVALLATSAAAQCTFTPNCDYGRGSRDSSPASSRDECCTLCSNRPGCAAGVWDGTKCWFKTAQQTKSGCQKSARSKDACIPKSIKPGPPPSPAPAPHPPGPPSAPKPTVPPTPAPKCAPGSDPLQVFILMGQSNMLGMGTVGTLSAPTKNSLANAVAVEGKYPYLYNKATKNWTTSKTVRNVFVQDSGGIHSKYPARVATNQWMQGPNPRGSIGPELGIGGMLERANPTTPYMMVKSCTGDRALGWDLLPPGTNRSTFVDTGGTAWTYAGYHDSPMKWIANQTQPPPIAWYAGLQYDGDIYRANSVLSNLSSYYPSTPPQKCYEVAGFFWWQGDKDSRDMGLSTHYEKNLVSLIKQLRVQYDSPKAKFVTASLGQTVKPGTIDSDANARSKRPGGGGIILQAMLNVANASKYPEFDGTVAAVYTHPLMAGPGASGSHYGHNAETYMNVGEAMGTAMVKLLKADTL